MDLLQLVQKNCGQMIKEFSESKLTSTLILLLFFEVLFFDKFANIEFFASSGARFIILVFLTASCVLYTSTVESSSSKKRNLYLGGIVLFHIITFVFWTVSLSSDYLLIQIPLLLATILLFHKSLMKENDSKVWEWQNGFARSLVEAFFVMVIYITAAFLLMYIIGFVFEFNAITFSEKFILKSGGTLVLFSAFLLRKSVPREPLNKFSENIVKFVVSPLWSIYVILLNVYVLKITLNWSLPKGMVAIPISIAFMAFSMKWWLLVPIKKDTVSEDSKFSKGLLWSQLALLLLYYVGVGRRIFDYGITQPRYFLILLGVLYTGIVFMSLSKKLNGRNYSLLVLVLIFLSMINIA